MPTGALGRRYSRELYTHGIMPKVMISMPPDLLERIDRAAGERRTSRSAFLQDAARRELGWPDPAAIDAALKRGRAALAGARRFESAELLRAERDARDERDRRR